MRNLFSIIFAILLSCCVITVSASRSPLEETADFAFFILVLVAFVAIVIACSGSNRCPNHPTHFIPIPPPVPPMYIPQTYTPQYLVPPTGVYGSPYNYRYPPSQSSPLVSRVRTQTTTVKNPTPVTTPTGQSEKTTGFGGTKTR